MLPRPALLRAIPHPQPSRTPAYLPFSPTRGNPTRARHLRTTPRSQSKAVDLLAQALAARRSIPRAQRPSSPFPLFATSPQTPTSTSSSAPSLSQLSTSTPSTQSESMPFTPRPLHPSDGPIVWVDLEMTGLDHHTDQILEVAILITNGNLDVVDDEGYHAIVRASQTVLDNMNPWCIAQHGSSGLTAACLASPLTLQTIEFQSLAYIQRWVPSEKSAVLAGSSVHMDRLFMLEGMPRVVDYLHYRIVDVSSIKELCKRWYPDLAQRKKVDNKAQMTHRALDDIRASISELKFYREHVFREPGSVGMDSGSGGDEERQR